MVCVFDLNAHPQPFGRPMTRRALLKIGALAPLGLGLPSLLAAAPARSRPAAKASFGRAKRCLLIYMWGAPSHIDLFDMKPEAPIEIRGEFQPIPTKVPGIQICEHLPHLARQTDKMAFIRSLTHSDNNHSTSAHWMLTGHKHALSAENFGASETDFPHIGSVLSKLHPSEGSLPTFVALPETIATTAGFVTPGQSGGILGRRYDPFRINQRPDLPDFQVENLLPVSGLDTERIQSRATLARQFDSFRARLIASSEAAEFTAFQQQALDLVTSPKARQAFDLSAEPAPLRDRYGRRSFGQSLLLARRLLEAGVELVTVYWHKEDPKMVANWDTHTDNFSYLRDLLPRVDQPLATLLDDLSQRGMLDDTLVVWLSEFGRTPKVNTSNAGRDHWGLCNSIWLAGGGIPGGQVYGSSDKSAAEPATNPVSPPDLSATLYHLLGLEPRSVIHDSLDRPFLISEGQVLHRLIG